MTENIYNEDYYDALKEGARDSARVLVPLVLDLVDARSVVDVGCGLGTWLSVFREHGIEELLGIDGPHIDTSSLEIAPEHFVAHDLQHPLDLERHFDLVVSLEVAEHLPAACAETFVSSLVGLGPVILFSAAIPAQGGEHHVNEQWPDYWAGLFREKNYAAIDCLRAKVWQNPKVQWWYAQNALLFVEKGQVEDVQKLNQFYMEADVLPLVHPKRLSELVQWVERHWGEKN